MQLEARLRAFAAIVRTQSLTRAAAELYVSQPAVSKHLASLEAELARPLVVRGRRSAQLTPAGEVLADYVLRAEALLATGRRALGGGAGTETGPLPIAASDVAATYLLPRVLARFGDLCPEVDVQLDATTSRRAVDLVRAHRVELAVTSATTAARELTSDLLVDDAVVLIGPTSLGGRRLRPTDLTGLTWFLPSEQSSSRTAIDATRRDLGLDTARGVTLHSWEAIKLGVADGHGIAAISRHAIENELQAGRFILLDVPRWRLPRPIFIVHARGVPLTPPATRFLDLLRQTYVSADSTPNSNLPTTTTSMIGRLTELTEVADLVRAGSRLVTLVGAGGSGKTRLALGVAARLVDDFPDGVYLVDLSPLIDADLVSTSIADALVLTSATELNERLRGRRLLLVLDNLEHLLVAVPQIAALLEASPDLAVLATSRVPLHARFERTYRVPPLPIEDAESLFLDRALDVNPRFEDGEPVRRICVRLDRLPLALELAAAQARGRTAEQLARLERSLPVLGNRRDAPARQRTLAAAIAWSYDLLDEEQRRLLATLAVFRGGWSDEAAEIVCDAEPGDLVALVDASLVRAMDQRFAMLQTVRDFAFKRLVESGTLDQVCRRHAGYLLALAERARPFARGPREREWLDRLLSEMDNIRAALSFALDGQDAALGLALAEALEPLWIRGERQREALRWLEPLLRLDGDVDLRVRAGALSLAGRAALETGDLDRAGPWSEAALEVARACGDDLRTAWALHGVGHLRAELGHLDSARVLFEESLDLFLRLGEHAPAGGRLTFLAYYAERQGDVERARALYLQGAEQYRLAGDDSGVGGCIHSVGDLALDQGDIATALDRFSEAQPYILRGGAPFDLALAVGGMAAVAALRGRRSDAGQLSGAFERLVAESERHLEPQDRWRYEQHLAKLEDRDVKAGRAMPDDEIRTLLIDVTRTLRHQRTRATRPPSQTRSSEPNIPPATPKTM